MLFEQYTIPFKTKTAENLARLGFFSGSLNDLDAIKEEYFCTQELQILSSAKSNLLKHQYLMSRICAKRIWQLAFQRHPHTLNITTGAFGQPIIIDNDMNQAISISHTIDVAAALLFPVHYPMAIDIEEITHDNLNVVREYVTAAELKLLDQYANILHLPFILWSAREALSKILTCGIAVPKDFLSVRGIVKQGNIYSITFVNFSQIKCFSGLYGANQVFSLAFPVSVIPDVSNLFKLKSKI